MNDSPDPRRALPAIDQLVTDALEARYGAARVRAEARRVVAQARDVALEQGAPSVEALRERLAGALDVSVAPMINATGVVLHTNLGRAPWSERARRAANAAMGYAAVELDARTGKRGRRAPGVERRLEALTGAEAALVVNNGAAALLLALSALARGGEVVVSRGQLVEIGGGFRIPEIMALSGATLREVGTTNRTHLRDFEAAARDAAALLWVHASNFRQVGFTTHPSIAALSQLAPPLVADVGSGALFELDDEPTVGEALAAGADVVCCSGDKLLGGPQAGLLFGSRDTIERLRRDPFMRAVRADKVTLAALEGTLDDLLLGEATPVRRMIEAPLAALDAACRAWLAALPEGADAEVVEVDGAIGGGSVPGRRWESRALAVRSPEPRRLFDALLAGEPRVLARVHRGRLLLDARTVAPLGQSDALEAALRRACAELDGSA